MSEKQTRVEPIKKNSTALLIIDMQNDSLHDEGYLAKLGKMTNVGFNLEYRRSVIPSIKKLADAFRTRGIPVVYCQTVLEPDWSDSGMPKSLHRPIKEGLTYMARGSWGAQIVDALAPDKKDYIVVAKCYNKFLYSPLELYLRNKKIDTLIFTGVGTNACVESTIRGAADLGFRVIVVTNGTAAKTVEVHQTALKEIVTTSLGELMTSDEILTLLK